MIYSGNNELKHLLDRKRRFSGFLLLLVLLTGCDRRDLTYYNESEITILADWTQSGLAQEEGNYGATILFYPRDGSAVQTVLMGDRSQETVRLRPGVYDIILFNRSFHDFSNIAFRGDSYGTLEAYSRKVETRFNETTRTESRVITASPDELAAASIEGFEVTEDMTGNYDETNPKTKARASTDHRFTLNLSPRKLTREVKATFHVTGLNNIRSAACRLDGAAESVYLSTGRYSDHTVAQEFHPDILTFTPGSLSDGTLTGTFEVFGFDVSATGILHLEALLVDGKTTFAQDFDQVKVTEDEGLEGTITINVEVTTEKVPDVKPEGGSGSGFDADVDGWGEETNTDVPI